MAPQKPSDLTYADVTPKSVYLDRRKFLRGVGITAIAAFAGKRLYDHLRRRNALQQLLRIRRG